MGAFDPKPPLNDDSPMPFGKHRGIPMTEVPVNYLHYLWTNGMEHDKVSPVAIYIRANLSVLESENKDLIWD